MTKLLAAKVQVNTLIINFCSAS